MKKFTTTLCLVCLFTFQASISNAQFVAASKTSNAAGSSVAISRQTGNDYTPLAAITQGQILTNGG